jgi:hypothetical protein
MSDTDQPSEETPAPNAPTQEQQAIPDAAQQDDLTALLGVESFPGEVLTHGAEPIGERRVLELEQKQASPPQEQSKSGE